MDAQIDNEAVKEALIQIHYYTLLPKHIRGIIKDFKAFKFEVGPDLFLN